MKLPSPLATLTALILGAAAYGAESPAQEPAASPSAASARTLAPPPTASTRGRGNVYTPPPGPFADKRSAVTLRRNVTLHIQGKINDTIPLDCLWFGIGPDFKCRTIFTTVDIGDNLTTPVIGTIETNLKEVEDGYQAIISAEARIPELQDSGRGQNAARSQTFIRYKSNRMATLTALKPGIPQKVASENGVADLVVTVTEMPDSPVLPTGFSVSGDQSILSQNVRITAKNIENNGKATTVSSVSAGGKTTFQLVVDSMELNGIQRPLSGQIQINLIGTAEGTYTVEYTAGSQIAQLTSMATFVSRATGTPTTSTTIEYTSLSNSGGAIIRPGQPITVFKSGQQEFTLTIQPLE